MHGSGSASPTSPLLPHSVACFWHCNTVISILELAYNKTCLHGGPLLIVMPFAGQPRELWTLHVPKLSTALVCDPTDTVRLTGKSKPTRPMMQASRRLFEDLGRGF
jgi:hypothetical protein